MMEHSKAQQIALFYMRQLRPYCERIEVAGSIRRCKPEVKDIELVCKPVCTTIRGKSTPCAGFIETVMQWKKIRGEAWDKYTCRELPEGICLDLFTATDYNWGLIYAIRTGSAEFSHKVLACGWVKKGYHSKFGILHKGNIPIAVKEEEDLFRIIGIDFIDPIHREYLVPVLK